MADLKNCNGLEGTCEHFQPSQGSRRNRTSAIKYYYCMANGQKKLLREAPFQEGQEDLIIPRDPQDCKFFNPI